MHTEKYVSSYQITYTDILQYFNDENQCSYNYQLATCYSLQKRKPQLPNYNYWPVGLTSKIMKSIFIDSIALFLINNIVFASHCKSYVAKQLLFQWTRLACSQTAYPVNIQLPMTYIATSVRQLIQCHGAYDFINTQVVHKLSDWSTMYSGVATVATYIPISFNGSNFCNTNLYIQQIRVLFADNIYS